LITKHYSPKTLFARSEAREWENFVYQTFSKSDHFFIMSLLAYLENKERGFGRYNNEKVFASLRVGDVSGQLFAEATRGFDFSKKYTVLSHLVWDIKIRRRLKNRFLSNAGFKINANTPQFCFQFRCVQFPSMQKNDFT
jgi:hypothetical protein